LPFTLPCLYLWLFESSPSTERRSVIVSSDGPEALATESTPPQPEFGAHPIGTLVLVGLYGVLFVIGFLVFYYLVFLPRGPLTQ
jgi:hypothetical protein